MANDRYCVTVRPAHVEERTQREYELCLMALLAFLGDGNTHLKGEYAEQVDKGIK